jgi:hypothetical protein
MRPLYLDPMPDLSGRESRFSDATLRHPCSSFQGGRLCFMGVPVKSSDEFWQRVDAFESLNLARIVRVPRRGVYDIGPNAAPEPRWLTSEEFERVSRTHGGAGR